MPAASVIPLASATCSCHPVQSHRSVRSLYHLRVASPLCSLAVYFGLRYEPIAPNFGCCQVSVRSLGGIRCRWSGTKHDRHSSSAAHAAEYIMHIQNELRSLHAACWPVPACKGTQLAMACAVLPPARLATKYQHVAPCGIVSPTPLVFAMVGVSAWFA